MPTKNKSENYISIELDWAEEQLSSWKAYVDANPLHELKDRVEMRVTARGTYPMVISTVESQGKFIQDTIKNYLALLEVVDKLREREENKQTELRGKQDPSLAQKQLLEKRNNGTT